MIGALSEFNYLRRMFVRLAGILLLLALILFAAPVSGGRSFTTLALERMRADLVPESVTLIVTNPLDAFVTQAIIAVYLALLLLAPIALVEVWRFVAPGLYTRERRALAWALLASLVLWLLGGVFAYAVLVPTTFGALYGFLPEGVIPLFSLRELVSLTAGLTLATAFLFLLPVWMALLSCFGFVPPAFWRTHARYAVLLTLIFSAIITPDGSGVSMVLLALPVCGLYALGYAGAKWLSPVKSSEAGSRDGYFTG